MEKETHIIVIACDVALGCSASVLIHSKVVERALIAIEEETTQQAKHEKSKQQLIEESKKIVELFDFQNYHIPSLPKPVPKWCQGYEKGNFRIPGKKLNSKYNSRKQTRGKRRHK